MAKEDIYKGATKSLGGSSKSPKKEVRSIHTEKGASGGYIHTHSHTHPEHHPDEKHVSKNQDDMVAHMLQHMGTPNPGEDATNGIEGATGATPDANLGGGAPQASQPTPGGAPATAPPTPAGI